MGRRSPRRRRQYNRNVKWALGILVIVGVVIILVVLLEWFYWSG